MTKIDFEVKSVELSLILKVSILAKYRNRIIKVLKLKFKKVIEDNVSFPKTYNIPYLEFVCDRNAL